MLKMIVATDLNGAIGYKNDLLCHIKEDMVRFKHLTMNSIVIMGSKTLMSLPNSAPLKNRENIIITSHPDKYRKEYSEYDNIKFIDNIDKLVYLYMMNISNDAWVIGGESIYKLFEPYCSMLYLTLIRNKFKNADKFFHKDKRWELIDYSSYGISKEDWLEYRFETYAKFKFLIDINRVVKEGLY